MAEYTLAQIRAMQEDAAERVREMNWRSKNTLMNGAAPSKAELKNAADAEKSEPENNGEKDHKAPLSFLKSLDLSKLISGGDQSLLLLLIIILMSDGGDDFLIYALIYIML